MAAPMKANEILASLRKTDLHGNLDGRGVHMLLSVPQEIFFHNVQTGAGVHSASYKMGTWGTFRDGKVARGSFASI
jgi:hypothetical protein